VKRPELSIIVVNWNTKQLLKNCLSSIQKIRKEVEGLEIIVVDNGSKDGSVEFVKGLGSQVRLIKNTKNLGFAKANNQGIKIAKGKYIFLLNSDTVVKRGALKKLVKYLEEHKDIAAVSPMLLNPDGSTQIKSHLKFPSVWRIILYHNVLLRPIIMCSLLRYLVVDRANNKLPFEVDHLSGAALIASRRVWQKTGGLDEDYFFFFEDVDWCYRVRKEGLGKLIIVPGAKVIHIGGASWKEWKERERYKFYKQNFTALLLFVKKNYPGRLFFYKLALTGTFLSNALVQLLRLRFGRAKVQLKLAFGDIVWGRQYQPLPLSQD